MTSEYFKLVSQELILKLEQSKQFITKHNPTIGLLTEEILRTFLRTYLPKSVSVEQGFIQSPNGDLSKQCDILVYNSIYYAPLYRVGEVVIVPEEAVICVIEVKTTTNSQIFEDALQYFENIAEIAPRAKTYLFIYMNTTFDNIHSYLSKHKYDHDTFQYLPNEIVGVEKSFHISKDLVPMTNDSIGYSYYIFQDKNNNEVSAFQAFYFSLYKSILSATVEGIAKTFNPNEYFEFNLSCYQQLPLFSM